MQRRTLLTGLAAAGLAAVGGSAVWDSPRHTESAADSSADADTDDDPGVTSLAATGFPSTICSTEAQGDPGIYAIDEPTFAADWSGHAVDDRYANNGRLGADWTVIGVERGDVARAYPVAVL